MTQKLKLKFPGGIGGGCPWEGGVGVPIFSGTPLL